MELKTKKTSNVDFSFTEEDLQKKEEELLNIIKNTITEFYNLWKKRNSSPSSRAYSSNFTQVRNHIYFKKRTIYIKIVDCQTISVIIWGSRTNISTIGSEYVPRNLKITFPINTKKLLFRIDSFIEYPMEHGKIIKDIFSRLKIKNEEDYQLLLKCFDNILVNLI